MRLFCVFIFELKCLTQFNYRQWLRHILLRTNFDCSETTRNQTPYNILQWNKEMSYHLVKCRQIYQIKVVKTMVSVWYHADLTNLTLMTFYVLNYHFILLYRKWINSILVIKCLIKRFYEICKSSFPPVKSLWTQQLLYWGFVKVVPLGPCPMCFLPNFTENIEKYIQTNTSSYHVW